MATPVKRTLINSNARVDVNEKDTPSYDLTQPLFKEALKLTYPNFLGHINVHAFSTFELRNMFPEHMRKTISAETHYLCLVLNMTTESLEFIVQRHKDGSEKRAETTIDAILSELLERKIRNEDIT
jgi:hypothetical protein